MQKGMNYKKQMVSNGTFLQTTLELLQRVLSEIAKKPPDAQCDAIMHTNGRHSNPNIQPLSFPKANNLTTIQLQLSP